MIMEVPKNNKMKDLVYQKAKSRHHSMMARCYNKRATGYKYYGEQGVTVDSRWHTFENFYYDLDKITGWDRDEFLKGNLALDKDYKIKGNKKYSKDTCCFITKEKNNKLKPNQQKRVIAMTPDGEITEFMNQSDFARDNNLQLSGIHNCLVGKWKHTNKWQFIFKDNYIEGCFEDPEKLDKVIVGLSPEGSIFKFTNATQFAKDNNLLEATVIYGCANMKSTHTKGWQFRFESDIENNPFKDKKDLNIVGERGRKVKAIDPQGKIWYTTNRSKFAREHNLDRHNIKKVLDGKKESTCGWVFSFE